jgi:hypothetical protein
MASVEIIFPPNRPLIALRLLQVHRQPLARLPVATNPKPANAQPLQLRIRP